LRTSRLSRGLIGHYFAGKDDLLLEAVKTVAAELGAAIRSAAHAATIRQRDCMP
jgi:AcrR family transcriptional regulator